MMADGLQILDRGECLRLLRTQTVGRLGVVVGGRPEIYPVNFVLAGEEILIRSDSGAKLTAATDGEIVFEVDDLDQGAQTGWSVMVHGSAHLVTGHDGRPGSQTRVLERWRSADLPYQLQIVATEITGRRTSPGPPDDDGAEPSGG